MDLVGKYVITGIITQGRVGYNNQHTKTYTIGFSRDGVNFVNYTENGAVKEFEGNSDADTHVEHAFSKPFSARIVRLYPYSDNQYTALRWDLLGCQCKASCKKSLIAGRRRNETDKLLSASSIVNLQHGAQRSPLNTTTEGGLVGSWSAGANNINQWIEMNLESPHKVSAVITQGRSKSNQYVTKYIVSYSSDGTTFTNYTEGGAAKVFDGNTDYETAVQHDFLTPFVAVKVRVHPTAWYSHISLRWDLLGCRASAS